jgi:uncharacterized protein YecA (UPF0149 family)
VIGDIEKKQHECTKVSGLQEAMENIRRQISPTNEPVDRWIGSLERAAFGLAETKDRMSRVESDV